jgi:hypothetical protein
LVSRVKTLTPIFASDSFVQEQERPKGAMNKGFPMNEREAVF